jgi:hypothetical protein
VSRVISTNSVGKERRQLRRTIAEALRHLARKPQFDEESRDLAALIVFCLRRLDDGVEQTLQAWEKRDYFLKADRFQRQWEWVDKTAYALESALLLGQWDKVPDVWEGCYDRLVSGGR